jgi:molybdopterin-guanine dinucleotide biosynthesis protein A
MNDSGKTRAGVVLAGGHSTRFGDRDKALAEVDGEPLLVRAAEGLAPAVDGVVINCRREQVPTFRAALEPRSVGCAFVCDPSPGDGPAAGLAAALGAVSAPSVAVVACDMPFVDASFLRWLFGALGDATGVVPRVAGALQPTHAVFATEPTRRAARDTVENASGSLYGVLDRIDATEVPEPRVLARTTARSFVDVDAPADLESVVPDEVTRQS